MREGAVLVKSPVVMLERPACNRPRVVQSKEGVQCFTDGCTGQVKLAQELEEEVGIDTHRRELLRLPDQAKKPERPPPAQEQLEQRRGRKKGPVQRAPEPGQPPSASVTADRDDDRSGCICTCSRHLRRHRRTAEMSSC